MNPHIPYDETIGLEENANGYTEGNGALNTSYEQIPKKTTAHSKTMAAYNKQKQNPFSPGPIMQKNNSIGGGSIKSPNPEAVKKSKIFKSSFSENYPVDGKLKTLEDKKRSVTLDNQNNSNEQTMNERLKSMRGGDEQIKDESIIKHVITSKKEVDTDM